MFLLLLSVISLTRISRDTPVLTGIPGGACAGGEFPRAARTKRWIFRCNFDIYPRPWTPPKYLDTIDLAAKDAKRTLRQVEWRTQASDHPIIRSIPTTQYLKFLIAQVL